MKLKRVQNITEKKMVLWKYGVMKERNIDDWEQGEGDEDK